MTLFHDIFDIFCDIFALSVQKLSRQNTFSKRVPQLDTFWGKIVKESFCNFQNNRCQTSRCFFGKSITANILKKNPYFLILCLWECTYMRLVQTSVTNWWFWLHEMLEVQVCCQLVERWFLINFQPFRTFQNLKCWHHTEKQSRSIIHLRMRLPIGEIARICRWVGRGQSGRSLHFGYWAGHVRWWNTACHLLGLSGGSLVKSVKAKSLSDPQHLTAEKLRSVWTGLRYLRYDAYWLRPYLQNLSGQCVCAEMYMYTSPGR